MRAAFGRAVLAVVLAGAGLAGPLAGEGAGYEGAVIGGSEVAPGQHAYVAAILERAEIDPLDAVFCGGTLVAPTWVLTSARCVVSRDPGSLDVVVGAAELRGAPRIPVGAVVVHPSFVDAMPYDNDVALLSLGSAVGATPPRLAGAADAALVATGAMVTSVGYGTDTHDQFWTGTLQAAAVPIMPFDACWNVDRPGQLCAGRFDSESEPGSAGRAPGPYLQDVGGPLLVGTTLVGVVYEHAWGLTSFGATRVSSVASWIASTSGAAGPVELPANVRRVAGASRFATAASIATTFFSPGVPAVHIVTGGAFPDALAAAPAAVTAEGPVLLTTPTALPPETEAALRTLAPRQIVVVGGSGAVSEGVLAQLRGLTSGSVTRVAGANRYETAAALSQRTFAQLPASFPNLFVASGESFADALGGAAAAGAPPSTPLLLVGRNAVPGVTMAEIQRLRPQRIFVLGGTAAVSGAVESALRMQAGEVVRIAGADRYETAARLATTIFSRSETVAVATGVNFPDGLVAGVLQAPLLLLPVGTVPASVQQAVRDLGATRVAVMGGAGAVTDAQARTLGLAAGG